MSHNDPLVIDLDIEECCITKFFIDIGSSVDLIYKETVKKIGIPDLQMKPLVRPVTGFDNRQVMLVGMIKLSVMAGNVVNMSVKKT